MTSSNGNIFRVTGPLCGEFTGPGEFPAQRPVTRSFDVFFDLRPNKRLNKQPWCWWFETPSWSLWRQCNVMGESLLLHSNTRILVISGISMSLDDGHCEAISPIVNPRDVTMGREALSRFEHHIRLYSIRVPGWVLKCLNLITAPGSVSNQPGSVTWLATAGI